MSNEAIKCVCLTKNSRTNHPRCCGWIHFVVAEHGVLKHYNFHENLHEKEEARRRT